MHLIDTHAHLDYPDFDPDRDSLIAQAKEAGVEEIITIGTRLPACKIGVELAHKHKEVWATVGIHPCDAHNTDDGYLTELREMAKSPRVVAIGEIGLDYHHFASGRIPVDTPELKQQFKDRQALFFRQQLELAIDLGLNVVIHQRDSWDDTLKILDEYGNKVRGVFHCFGGTLEEAQSAIEKGHLVSFTGIVTFKNGKEVQRTAQSVPEGSFMVETDCPFLAPAPHRGKRCEPTHTRLVADKIAELRGVSVEKIAELTTETARKFFKFAR